MNPDKLTDLLIYVLGIILIGWTALLALLLWRLAI